MKTSVPRSRQQGAFTPRVAVLYATHSDGTRKVESTQTDSVGQKDTMDDWVTKPFIPGRTIANKPMLSVKTTRTHEPAIGQSTLHNPGYTGWVSYDGELMFVRDSALDALLNQIPGVDTQNLIAQACTSALANVRRPELSGLVSIAEMRSTVQSLVNPLNGALRFLARNVPSNKKRRKPKSRKELKATLKDVSDQHLTIIFGLMPFISDVQSTLKALEAIEPVPVRFTAHGSASAFGKNSGAGTDLLNDDGNNTTYLDHAEEVSKTVTVRAYQLYEASVSLQNAMGLSVKDVPQALWQTATLSFVVDWFVNVGDYIAALTPQEGINYLTSGYTVTTVTSGESSYSYRGVHSKTDGWVSEYSGGSQTRVVVAKQRVPSSLQMNAAITFKSNMYRDVLDTFKVAALVSLITQRLTKLL